MELELVLMKWIPLSYISFFRFPLPLSLFIRIGINYVRGSDIQQLSHHNLFARRNFVSLFDVTHATIDSPTVTRMQTMWQRQGRVKSCDSICKNAIPSPMGKLISNFNAITNEYVMRWQHRTHPSPGHRVKRNWEAKKQKWKSWNENGRQGGKDQRKRYARQMLRHRHMTHASYALYSWCETPSICIFMKQQKERERRRRRCSGRHSPIFIYFCCCCCCFTFYPINAFIHVQTSTTMFVSSLHLLKRRLPSTHSCWPNSAEREWMSYGLVCLFNSNLAWPELNSVMV